MAFQVVRQDEHAAGLFGAFVVEGHVGHLEQVGQLDHETDRLDIGDRVSESGLGGELDGEAQVEGGIEHSEQVSQQEQEVPVKEDSGIDSEHGQVSVYPLDDSQQNLLVTGQKRLMVPGLVELFVVVLEVFTVLAVDGLALGSVEDLVAVFPHLGDDPALPLHLCFHQRVQQPLLLLGRHVAAPVVDHVQVGDL